MTVGTIIDDAVLKDRVNLTGTGTNTTLESIIYSVEDWVCNEYLQRRHLVKTTATVTEYFDGWTPFMQSDPMQRHALVTPDWPVTSSDVKGLWGNDEAIPARTSVNDYGYSVDESYGGQGRLMIWGYPVTFGAQNIKLEYTPGYTTGTTGSMPRSIQEAIYQICVAFWNRRGLEGYRQSQVGAVNLTMQGLVNSGEITDALRLLRSHRRL
jgi:hypothetical protein